ncbi:PREDICTED: protein FATTY ACID EXPORT 1, chloroplastic [Lupinus angustifolius]|uniref:protein FATTY ACID EXPORT 1, chloroplastic n=1 Tax=Lupinus angustifolius TaxID=3871 RepID=UPI00092FB185|nr:PREDICTED: protein FATTY ACID EXPORT 1, chloroplastic [Lupinus angustifolius]
MAATISQLSCFSALHRNFNIQSDTHFLICPSFRSYSKLSVSMSLERNGTETAGSDTSSSLSYAADVSKLQVEENQNSHLTKEEDHDAEKIGVEEVKPEVYNQQKGTAKIHDFCLGIPFGGFVLTGGIIGFLLSRNPATLTSGVLFGGALLFLSTLSLKIWKQGKSSLPFILGQAALSGLLIWKNFQSYSLAKKLFPTGFSAIISSAMLCFYLYVLISGGNPPPKKLKPSASTA